MSAGILAQNAVNFDEIEDSSFNIAEKMIPLHQIPVSIEKFKVLDDTYRQRLVHGQKVNFGLDGDKLFESDSELQLNDKVLLQDRNGLPFGIGEIIIKNSDNLVIAVIRGLV